MKLTAEVMQCQYNIERCEAVLVIDGMDATVAYTNRSAGYSYNGPDALFIILLGADGNTYFVNTSVGTKVGDLFEDSPRGTSFEVTGQVKKHKVTDKGEAVTVLTRCKAATKS